MRGLNAYLKTQQYINLATSGIANNIMVFRVQTGITALVSIQKRVDLGPKFFSQCEYRSPYTCTKARAPTTCEDTDFCSVMAFACAAAKKNDINK